MAPSSCQVNLGRYQAPIHVAQRTLCQYGLKGYLFGAACLAMGLSLVCSKKAPKAGAASSSSSAQGGVDDPAAPAEMTMKQHAHQPWDANAANSLHKAGQFFSSAESYWTQRLVVWALLPTCEFHSRCPADGL